MLSFEETHNSLSLTLSLYLSLIIFPFGFSVSIQTKVEKRFVNGRRTKTHTRLFGYGEDSFLSYPSFRRNRVADSGM